MRKNTIRITALILAAWGCLAVSLASAQTKEPSTEDIAKLAPELRFDEAVLSDTLAMRTPLGAAELEPAFAVSWEPPAYDD